MSVSVRAYNRAFNNISLYMPIPEPLQHICLCYMLVIKALKCLLICTHNKNKRFSSANSYNSSQFQFILLSIDPLQGQRPHLYRKSQSI